MVNIAQIPYGIYVSFMSEIILDCDLMRYRDSGLYHYCLNLGNYVNEALVRDNKKPIALYVPEKESTSFNKRWKVITERPMHKVVRPFLFNCKLWHAPFQSGRVLPKTSGVKVLLTIHDLNPLHEGKTLEEQKKSLTHTQALIDRSDALVCISEFTRQDVLKNCKVGKKPVFVVHNGTHAVGTPGLDPVSYRPVRPFVFAMGYVNTKKNFHVLLALLEDENVELVIAGRLDEPDYIANMRAEAEEMKVLDRLHILGPVSENDKAWYLQNCLAFALPSLAEGFGAPVVEAMQFGKPLFLSRLTSLPEIGGDEAFYFDTFSRDHMNQVFKKGLQTYGSTNLKDRLQERAKLFRWREKAEQYIDVYQKVLRSE